MDATSTNICRRCLWVCFGVGVFCLLFGLAIEPLLPHFQMDAFLTPDELADQAKYDATFALLNEAKGNRWIAWLVAGAVLIVASAIGLAAAYGRLERPSRQRANRDFQEREETAASRG